MEPNQIRKEVRVSAVLPVRIYGIDANGKPFNSMAHTLNVSKSGALLANVEIPLNLGDVIGVQKGMYKGKFQVEWIGRKGSSSQGQVGLACTEGARNIWGLEERPYSASTEEARAMRRTLAGGGPAREKRAAQRYSCDIGVQFRQQDSDVSLWSRCTDVSEGGCYVDCRAPLAVGTLFELTLFLDSESMTVPALVRTSFNGMGMGIQFIFASEDHKILLRRFLREKFGAAVILEEATTELPALEKLSECVEQLRAWSKATALDQSDKEELEQLAISLRRELQGMRAEINERIMQRRTEMLTSA